MEPYVIDLTGNIISRLSDNGNRPIIELREENGKFNIYQYVGEIKYLSDQLTDKKSAKSLYRKYVLRYLNQ